MDLRQDATPVFLEVPQDWFVSPLDGARHRQMFTTLMAALAKRRVALTPSLVPFGSHLAPRTPPTGGFTISYHSIGDTPGVWRIKETSIVGWYTFDPNGWSAWSSLARHPEHHAAAIEAVDAADAMVKVEQIRQKLRSGNVSKYQQPAKCFDPPGPYVFMAMQLLEDPVSEFARVPHLDVLRRAAEIAAARGKHLVVKRHPLCRNPAVELALQEARDLHRSVIVTDASVHALIESADAVLVANSGVGLEALLYGKPVFAFAESEYDLAARPIETLDDLDAVFADAIPADGGRSARFLAYFLEHCCFHMDSVASAERQIDRALAAAGAATGAPVLADDASRLLESNAQLEAARRQLLKAREEAKAYQRAATEAVQTATRLADALKERAAAPAAPAGGPSAEMVVKLAERAVSAARAETALTRIAGDAFTAYADLAGLWRRAGAPTMDLDAELTRSEETAAGSPKARIRNVTQADYQRLHDTDAGYQANNWLVDHADLIAAARPGVIAEVGCGNGQFIKAIAPRVDRVIALDWARSPLLDPLPGNAEFRATNVLVDALPAADLCCSADVLEHFEPKDLPALIDKLHRAAPANYHVIACYDDGHSHLSVLHPGQWLALFRAADPAYRLAAVLPRRGRPDQIVCVVTNLASAAPVGERPTVHVGTWAWINGRALVIRPDRLCLMDGRPVADWVAVSDDTVAIRWRGMPLVDFARIDAGGSRLDVANNRGDRYAVARS